MGAVMLTVQKSNTEAMAFYNKLRYSGKLELVCQLLIVLVHRMSVPSGYWLILGFYFSSVATFEFNYSISQICNIQYLTITSGSAGIALPIN
jgi:ribosomal protein S18 acetylase RimI-like enzyme